MTIFNSFRVSHYVVHNLCTNAIMTPEACGGLWAICSVLCLCGTTGPLVGCQAVSVSVSVSVCRLAPSADCRVADSSCRRHHRHVYLLSACRLTLSSAARCTVSPTRRGVIISLPCLHHRRSNGFSRPALVSCHGRSVLPAVSYIRDIFLAK